MHWLTVLVRRGSSIGLLLVVPLSASEAQDLRFSGPLGADTGQAMSTLALQALAIYKDSTRDRYLDNLFRLQLVAGRYADANKTLRSLRALRRNRVSLSATATNVLYAVLPAARQRAPDTAFAGTFRQSFRSSLARLDDKISAPAIRALRVSRPAQERAVNRLLQQQRGKESISLADALQLIKAYQVQQAFRTIVPLARPLVAADDDRRYIIEKNIAVRTPDGATVCTMVVRPRAVTRRLPALLDFTIYADTATNLLDARRAASNGYVGVIGLTRGKLCSPAHPVPYTPDGADAAAPIDWIATQPWSDGRVGMYGGSYDGFTQWAAAKHMPKALKTIIPAVAAAPGIDVPMDGNLFLSFVYPWPFYTTNLKTLDDSTYNDFARWSRLNRDWYASGRAYRDLDKIDGAPNPIFDNWLAHPSYDSYWQSMIRTRRTSRASIFPFSKRPA